MKELKQVMRVVVWLVLFGVCKPSLAQKNAVLNISASLLDSVTLKVQQQAWAAERFEKIKKLADSISNDPFRMQLPKRGGNWEHFYVDPEEGKPLVPGKYLGNWKWEHHNQAGTKVFKSDSSKIQFDYDGVLILTQVHKLWSNRLFALALAFKVTGNKKYLSKGIDIVKAYNEIYTSIPIHNKENQADFSYRTGVGRVSAQALSESVWLTEMLQGLALLWSEFPETLKEETKNQLLLPAVDIIMRSPDLGIHNISCWYLAAVGMTGYLLNQDALVQWSLTRKGTGLESQLDKGFTALGHWFERSPSYHFYALKPLLLLAETAKNHGKPNYVFQLKKAFDAPIALAMPDMQLPRFNDSRETYLPSFSAFYEYGFYTFGVTEYQKIVDVSRQYPSLVEKGEQQNHEYNAFDYSLLYGKKKLSGDTYWQPKSKHFETDGVDILSIARGNKQVWMATKYDAHPDLGWHAHPDALSFVLFGKNTIISPDPGHAPYSSPLQDGWYKTTLAHNALVVNQKNQALAPAQTLGFGISRGRPYSIARTQNAYPGVSHTRYFCLFDTSTIVILDDIESETNQLYEVAYHQRGEWELRPSVPICDEKERVDYDYLTNIRQTDKQTQTTFSTKLPNTGEEILVQLAASSPVNVFTATAPGLDFEPTPMAIARYSGKSLVLVWIINLDNKPKFIKSKIGKNGVLLTRGREKAWLRIK